MKRMLMIGMALALPATGGAVIIEEPVPAGAITVTASSTFSPPQDCRHLVDGSGLSGARHDADGGARTMWHTVEQPTNAWVRFDFAAPQPVAAIRIWNHSQAGLTDRGFRQARVLTSADGTTWQTQAITLERGTGAAETVPLAGVRPLAAIMLAADSNYGGTCYGLSEVQFLTRRDVAEQDLPFPSGMECRPQPYYGHRPDGRPGRAVTLALAGAKLYGLMMVVFPAPVGPTMAMVWPGSAVKLMPRKTCTSS